MKIVLQNSYGLFLMSMGQSRNDHSFTKDITQALVFDNKPDAEARQRKLHLLKLKLIELEG